MGSSLVLNRRPKVPAEDTAAFGAIAERFRRAGALEQAVSLCRDGLKKFPDHVSARVTLGWSLLDLGKYDEARTELEQVMRRAPDNLAAIRGLAELHDRFEHTLNLPMDGPGQWPPPPDSAELESAAEEKVAALETNGPDAEGFDAGAIIEDSGLEAAPAELGLPLWSPEPAAPAMAEAAASAHTVTSPGAGMSSVREIDPFAGAPVPADAAPPVEQIATQAQQPIEAQIAQDAVAVSAATPDVAGPELGVTDETLAALIAEAESLDAVADLAVVEEPGTFETVESVAFAAPVDLVAADSAVLEMATSEFEAEKTVEENAAVESADLELDDDQAAIELAAFELTVPAEVQAPEVVAAAAMEESAPVVAEMATPAEVAEAPEVVAAAAMEESAPVVAEMVASAEVAEAVEAVAEIQTAEVLAFAARQTAEVDEAVAPSGFAPTPVSVKKGNVTLAALERMLAGVQARRLQLMTESVA